MPTPEAFREEPDWGEYAQAEADARAEVMDELDPEELASVPGRWRR